MPEVICCNDEPLRALNLLKAVGMVAVQMGNEHGVKVGILQPHPGQLLVNADEGFMQSSPWKRE